LTLLRDFFLFGCCASLIYYLLVWATGILFSRRAAKTPPLLADPPTVALLKPLHGWDEHLLPNLKSFMDLDYPDKEFIFGITTEDDPAVSALDEIRRLYPEARITETVGEEVSTNRKVGKLLRMLRQPPSSEILVMSDADVRVDRDYLRRIVVELDGEKKIGMVTCVYKAIAPQNTFGAKLEALFINTDFTPTAILSYYLEPMRHAFASTVAIRQSVLKEAGGLEAVKNSFGDDFALARRVAAQGYRIRLSSSIVTMVMEKLTFREFWDHQLRWARVDRKIRPLSLARMLINGPFWALMLLLASGFGMPWLAVAGLTLAARLGLTAWTYAAVLRLPARLSELLLVPLKDLLMQIVWLASLQGDTVEWRGRKLRLLPTGEMEEIG
jgi:ceramide glucosyltransferase